MLETDDPNRNYNFITEKFLEVVNRHAPLKQKTLRGNQAPFMTKKLKKEIYTGNKLKNKNNRKPTEEKKQHIKNKEINVYLYVEKRLRCISTI